MNLIHLKYIITIAEQGSLGRAAEVLTVAQPNLSRAVKEMEADLGIRIFNRTPKGMTLTPDGETFLNSAHKIIDQIDTIKAYYSTKGTHRRVLTVSAPRSAYVAKAMASFTKDLQGEPAEIQLLELSAAARMKAPINPKVQFSILRCKASNALFFEDELQKRSVAWEKLGTFRYTLVFREDSPLADLPEIRIKDLKKLVEICPCDPSIPVEPLGAFRNDSIPKSDRIVILEDRATVLEVLSASSENFLWSSPLPEDLKKRYGLIQRPCAEEKTLYLDLVTYRSHRTLNETEASFLSHLKYHAKELLNEEKKIYHF
jgi:DNA-binding transcriptional LysR family regulator